MKKISLVYLLLLSNVIIAQQEISLQSAIDSAMMNNFTIQIAKNNNEISKKNNSYGMAGGLPSISLSANDNNSLYNLNQKLSSGSEINQSGVGNNAINAGLNAGIILFNGFKVMATKERLELLEKQSEITLNQQIQSTIAEIMSVYYDIIRQQNYLKIIENTLDFSEKKKKIIEAKKLAGMANDADYYQAKIDYTMAEQSLKSQQQIIEQAKINLQQLMGVTAFFPVNIKDSIRIGAKLNHDSIINFLIENPTYQSAEYQVKISQQYSKEIGAQRYPTLKLNAAYNYSYSSSTAGFNLLNQNYGPQIGASLYVPIFNGSNYKKQFEITKFQLKNAELSMQNTMLQLKADAENTYQSYQIALLQYESQLTNFDDANRLMELVLKQFELNQATILDVKAAQTSYEMAAYMLVNYQFSAKIAEIELKKMIFQLSNESR